MDFNDLKSDWQNAGNGSIDEKSLQMMTKVSQHPTLKKLRVKMIIEVVLLTALLFMYYDGFDGDKKPLYANVLLVAAIACYITNNVITYVFIKNPVKANDILASIQSQVKAFEAHVGTFHHIFSHLYSCSSGIFCQFN